MLTEHPLHAFSPRYFSAGGVDERFFSYSEANAEASRSITATQAPAMPPFITEALPQIEESNRNLELRELIDFWGNPSKYFVRRRLGLTLRKTDDCLSDNEPFELDNLEKYLIKQELLEEELEAGTTVASRSFPRTRNPATRSDRRAPTAFHEDGGAEAGAGCPELHRRGPKGRARRCRSGAGSIQPERQDSTPSVWRTLCSLSNGETESKGPSPRAGSSTWPYALLMTTKSPHTVLDRKRCDRYFQLGSHQLAPNCKHSANYSGRD